MNNPDLIPNQLLTQIEAPVNSSIESLTETKQLGKSAAKGALISVGVSHLLGGVGLVIAGPGVLSVALAGSIAGAATYGVKKILFKS